MTGNDHEFCSYLCNFNSVSGEYEFVPFAWGHAISVMFWNSMLAALTSSADQVRSCDSPCTRDVAPLSSRCSPNKVQIVSLSMGSAPGALRGWFGLLSIMREAYSQRVLSSKSARVRGVWAVIVEDERGRGHLSTADLPKIGFTNFGVCR